MCCGSVGSEVGAGSEAGEEERMGRGDTGKPAGRPRLSACVPPPLLPSGTPSTALSLLFISSKSGLMIAEINTDLRKQGLRAGRSKSEC